MRVAFVIARSLALKQTDSFHKAILPPYTVSSSNTTHCLQHTSVVKQSSINVEVLLKKVRTRCHPRRPHNQLASTMDPSMDRPRSVPPSGSHLDPAIDRPAPSQGRLSQLIPGRSSRSRVSSISTDGGKTDVTGTVEHSGVYGHGSTGTKGSRGEHGCNLLGLKLY